MLNRIRWWFSPFKWARRLMARTLRRDAGTYEAYRSDVAMLLRDRYGITDCETRNRAADDLLGLIFTERAQGFGPMSPAIIAPQAEVS